MQNSTLTSKHVLAISYKVKTYIHKIQQSYLGVYPSLVKTQVTKTMHLNIQSYFIANHPNLKTSKCPLAEERTNKNWLVQVIRNAAD